MASSNKTVTVLAPNGRRQNVKVTPNTTILQILEEVCNKQGLKPDEYDIKHHNNILDVSSIIRFSGLPNNAQLELCTIQKARAESVVTLGLQLENGTRLTGNYFPNDNLWNILMKLCPNEVKIDENPVVIYMRQEIYGLQALESTTLKSLGITSGRAMIRLLHRKPEELHKQANISAPLPSKPTEEKPYIRKLQKLDPEPKNDAKIDEPRSPVLKENKQFVNDFIKKEKTRKSNDHQKIKSSKTIENETREIVNERIANKKTQGEPEEINFTFLGERNALAFSLDMAQTIPSDLPDEFFDLTIQDAKKLLKDLKQRRVELEESPLQTAAHRNLEQNKKILRNLNQYKRSVIRVQFPDRTVLQGTFKPLETISNVKEFVTAYLEDTKQNFHLYTTPPKLILKSETSLLDADCVPSALVHFGLNAPVKENYKYLKQSLFSQFTSHSLASLAAAKSRGYEKKLAPNEEVEETISIQENIVTPMDVDVNVGASTSGVAASPPRRLTDPQPKEKVPKWFRPSK